RSCAIYLAIRQSLGEPDPFRLRYRQEMIEAVGLVVRQRLVGEDLPIFLRHWAEEHVPAEDRLRFAAAAEAQLHALHEGNFARFRLRPSEFEAWFENRRFGIP
ncbi:MAG: Fic family protein, partial [Gemmatimonadaceae bacterium]|nr:Fic family protein [Gloeobacterales cyanobacterium ES-bin-141]